MFYTRCYNQYGKLPQMFDWNTEQKLLKMCGGKFKIEYFLKNEYDEQQYQQVYQPARWRVVYMGGTVVDLRQAMEIDGGQFPRAMKKVLRELAMN